MSRTSALTIWLVFAVCSVTPLALAAMSPLLAWRDPVYIAAGFAGVAGMSLLLAQPLLAAGLLPGLTGSARRRLHRVVGGLLVLAVVAHVVGLWLTSPPDVVDALLFSSPTPFSVWGVVAMWAVFATAVLMVLRRRMRLRNWRLSHKGLALVVVVGSIVHALLIEGTMETMSKIALCALVGIATFKAFVIPKAFASYRRLG